MSTSNYTTPDDNKIDDHIYEMINRGSVYTNAVYTRAPILTRKSDDYDYAHGENINVSKYV
jgi:hypothetical protein